MVQMSVFMLPSSMAMLKRLRHHWGKTQADTLRYLCMAAEYEILGELNDQERTQYYSVQPEHRLFS